MYSNLKILKWKLNKDEIHPLLLTRTANNLIDSIKCFCTMAACCVCGGCPRRDNTIKNICGIHTPHPFFWRIWMGLHIHIYTDTSMKYSCYRMNPISSYMNLWHALTKMNLIYISRWHIVGVKSLFWMFSYKNKLMVPYPVNSTVKPQQGTYYYMLQVSTPNPCWHQYHSANISGPRSNCSDDARFLKEAKILRARLLGLPQKSIQSCT